MAGRLAFSSAWAALALVELCVLPAVASAACGTITFLCAIVEPPYQIQASPITSPATSFASPSGAAIRFSDARQSASVRVDGVRGTALVVRCTDARPMAAQGCHLGQRGGSMSVGIKSPGPVDATPGAVLTVTYD